MPSRMAAGRRMDSLPYALNLSDSVRLAARAGVALAAFVPAADFCATPDGTAGDATAVSATDKSSGSNLDCAKSKFVGIVRSSFEPDARSKSDTGAAGTFGGASGT